MLIDRYGRNVNYLRVSLTERCNFRCQYCMPEKPFSWVPKENILSYEELFEFIKIAIDAGIEKVRITGGEPTLKEDLDYFISLISRYAPSVDLAMTTNGYLLEEQASKLFLAGLKRVNISLDSLKQEVAHDIAQKDVLPNVLRGIEKALDVGMKVKLNMVPLKGINESEMGDIIEYGRKIGASVRFIEFMENRYATQTIQGLKKEEIVNSLQAKGYVFDPVIEQSSSPATIYRLADGYEFGIIEPHTASFCEQCNRIRLTAEGFLIPCLYFDEALSIKEAMQTRDIKKATEILATLLANKPEKNRWSEDNEISGRAFYHTGG